MREKRGRIDIYQTIKSAKLKGFGKRRRKRKEGIRS